MSDDAAFDAAAAAKARAERFGRLDERPDPASLIVTVPAYEDDTPEPAPAPPAAVPELIAATQIADANPLGRLARLGRAERRRP